MTDNGSLAVRREYAGGDVRFEFPVRPLGAGKLFGLFAIGFGLMFVWGPAHSVWEAIQKWLRGAPVGPETFFNLFFVPVLLVGCVPIAIGLLILFGRCRLEWKDGGLRS